METIKNFYKWFYSLSDNEQQEQLNNSKLLFPFNTWDMNYHLIINNYELLIDVCDVADELANINSEDINDIKKEQLIELTWKIYD